MNKEINYIDEIIDMPRTQEAWDYLAKRLRRKGMNKWYQVQYISKHNWRKGKYITVAKEYPILKDAEIRRNELISRGFDSRIIRVEVTKEE